MVRKADVHETWTCLYLSFGRISVLVKYHSRAVAMVSKISFAPNQAYLDRNSNNAEKNVILSDESAMRWIFHCAGKGL